MPKFKKIDLQPVGRFPGELLALGLVIAFVVQYVAGPVAAIVTAAVIGLVQVLLLRRQRMAREALARQLTVSEAETKKWQERANTFMSELSHYKEQVDYQDPETGVGSTRQFEVEFIKQVARFRRRGEPFTVALLQLRDPDHPDAMLDAPVIAAAAHRLAETARVEDALCRVARRGFAVLLAGAGREGASVYINRARQRFEEVPVLVSGKRISLTLTGGAATYETTMTEVQDILSAAARDLHANLRSHLAEEPDERPVRVLARAS